MPASNWIVGLAALALLAQDAGRHRASPPPGQTPPAAAPDCDGPPNQVRTAQGFGVEISGDCVTRTMKVVVSGREGQGAAWLAVFTTIELCASPKVRDLMRKGWKADLLLNAAGARRTTPMPLDCSLVDPLLTGKNPPPPGTPEAIAAGIPTPPEPATRPVVDVSIGEPLQQAAARSTYPLPSGNPLMVVVQGKVDLIYRHGGDVRFDHIGDCSDCAFLLDLDESGAISGLHFNDQDRPLKLAEAFARARSLHDALMRQGFDEQRDASFHVWDPEQWRNPQPATWDEAGTDLAAEPLDIKAMRLFTLAAPDAQVEVSLFNWRRKARDFGRGVPGPFSGATVFDGNGGYEWGLDVAITRQRLTGAD
ncbi:MAG TPA: hypothetical protein VG939_00160 [Caulobacteraceae bacterium]|nr:hypothetical protein [Caulobacteraceae bacterium]